MGKMNWMLGFFVFVLGYGRGGKRMLPILSTNAESMMFGRLSPVLQLDQAYIYVLHTNS